jgi:hypothetical protein
MNQNTSTFIGLGALGTLIAYFGYQYLDEDESKKSQSNDNLYNEVEHVKDNTLENVKELYDLSKNIINETSNTMEDISKNKIKLEVEEQITKEVAQKKSNYEKKETNKWSNYWENQYKNIDKKQEITVG